ncbi:hypothetical protein SEMRO_3044_G342700.1 [Seminavis robusta]|uniref:Uncharacterized protein n=1 Tax=Seminavis robusta TaxID=568900 RepID=A0A9N8F4Q9_9STRA|nr:hypothetical protein SEMRO_3044_G342700.1 [Seminavis robusta]|eukprot:Sro3044_g342700.1 n/a (200) ;mRNA; f:393-992
MDRSHHGPSPVVDPSRSYNTIVALDPITDIESMKESRHVAIGFETYDGTIRDYRGSATFDRFGVTASYRFLIHGVQVSRKADGSMPDDDGEVKGSVETQELRLTSRFQWYTRSHKIKGKETFGRIIRMRFLRPEEEEHPHALRQIDVIVPMSDTEDKGKLLELAIQQATCLVDANIAEGKLHQERARQEAKISLRRGPL